MLHFAECTRTSAEALASLPQRQQQKALLRCATDNVLLQVFWHNFGQINRLNSPSRHGFVVGLLSLHEFC